jgi:hypothetical protein
MRLATLPGTVLAAALAAAGPAGAAERIVDLPTRPGGSWIVSGRAGAASR